MGRWAGWAVILVILALCAEAVGYVALNFVPQFDRFVYRTPQVPEAEYAAYVADRDPVLGWPSEAWLAERADARHSRISPANAALGEAARPCISVYGDSFAYGDEVGDEAAWANVLADRLGCRVNNFGVGGYGADQAVMRLEKHLAEGRELGGTLILTLYPDNLNRHMNQWRNLLTGQPLSFKPAFRVDGDGLAPEPIFAGDHQAFEALADDPGAYLATETYLPDTPGFRRMRRVGFPYALDLAGIVLDQVKSFRGFGSSGRANFFNYPVYYDDASGPSEEKKAVTAGIVRRFAALCKAEGKRCVFVITPSPELVLQRDETGAHDLGPWLKPAAGGLIFLDATDMFDDLDDICAHVVRADDCGGHYNEAGNARLAAFVEAGLQ